MAQEIADSKLIDTWASSGTKIEPDITKIIEGWQLGEQPPHEYMNWLQNTFGSKLNHILKNGVASWNNETEYLAGSSVQHNGNVWLCKATNTNSAPTDANANWKRTITVESLTTVLGGYVALTGNQTIAGVKTFSSSPIVPTPTTGTQAVNKDYVDNVATLNINALYEETIPIEEDVLVIQKTNGLLKKVKLYNIYSAFMKVLGYHINISTEKTTLANNDGFVIGDSQASSATKKVTWANIKATLLSYFDGFYPRTTSIFAVEQAWQVVTGSRVAGTTYTNPSNSKAMLVLISNLSVDQSKYSVNGVAIGHMDGASGVIIPICFIVPPSGTYSINFGAFVAGIWAEFK